MVAKGKTNVLQGEVRTVKIERSRRSTAEADQPLERQTPRP